MFKCNRIDDIGSLHHFLIANNNVNYAYSIKFGLFIMIFTAYELRIGPESRDTDWLCPGKSGLPKSRPVPWNRGTLD